MQSQTMDELSPPLEITICARNRVLQLLSTGAFDAVISINDPRNRPNRWEAHHREKFKKRVRSQMREDAPTLFLWFWDSDETVHDGPCQAHIDHIRGFVSALPRGARLLIHCRFGVSRSTAAGIIALCQVGLSFNDAWKEIRRVRPIAIPNEYMIKLAALQ